VLSRKPSTSTSKLPSAAALFETTTTPDFLVAPQSREFIAPVKRQ
jgi:hypothetical protein